jgi:Ca2+-transporting ATPase
VSTHYPRYPESLSVSNMDFYRKPVDDLFILLNSRPTGLSAEEVRGRQAAYGYNALQTETPVNPLVIFISQFKSFIIYILLFAVVFSLLIGEYVDTLIILAILLANAVIGFFQELGAHRSLEALKKISTVQATVIRAGRVGKVAARQLVPGDIVQLEDGDKVPADLRIRTAW